uniref:RNA helicase n=1 Tax=Rhodosorus marinus TaxID=101924 RepID=A0A7S0BDG9_9RHOD
MGLDVRILRACKALGFEKPTPVQASMIPAALMGRDVLAAAPTGSGKTAAFLVPVLNSLVSKDTFGDGIVRAVILVPTRELCYQVAGVSRKLLKYAPQLSVRTLVRKSGDGSVPTADLLVATPSALAERLDISATQFDHVQFVVIDEADLVLSYGYDEETRRAIASIPASSQSMLVSASLGEDLEELKKLVLRKPMLIKITMDEVGNSSGLVTHNVTTIATTQDKYLVTYALLRLRVLTGKTLIFVNEIDTAFRLKLFLDKFSIRSATLNGELPLNSRIHCVEQFNGGVFDVLVACDEDLIASRSEDKPNERKPKRDSSGRENEFGLSRGIDFHEVSTVLNFGLPFHSNSYMHRAGRTARAGRTGTVLSLAIEGKEQGSLEKICAQQGLRLEKLVMRMDQVESLRYRVEDSLRSITRAHVLEARLRDVKREMLASEKLQDFFDSNPKDFEALKHDKALTPQVQPHLGDLPAYLLPAALREKAQSRAPMRRKSRPNKKRLDDRDPLDNVGRKNRSHETSRDRYRHRKGIARKRRGPRKAGNHK